MAGPPPIWRTPLAAMMVGWMALALAAIPAQWRLSESLPSSALIAAAVAIYAVAPVVLLVWSLVALMRDPVTGWLAPAVLLGFCGGLIPLLPLLIDQSVRMNFDAHRPAYDAIVAEARNGRLVAARGTDGWIEGESRGVRFRFLPERPERVQFVWRTGYASDGVIYDATPCKPSRLVRCVSLGDPLEGNYSHYSSLF